MERNMKKTYGIIILFLIILVALSGCFVREPNVINPTETNVNNTPYPINYTQNVINIINETSIINLIEGQRDGPLLVQEIYPDHIDGLIFIQYPVEFENGTPSTVYIGQRVSNGCDEFLTLLSIDDKKAKFLKTVFLKKPCPICLSENTTIDTPNGSINIKNLKEGMIIWTSDKLSLRHNSTILKTSKVAVSADHKMMHIVLIDSRELFASLSHQLADGRPLGSISAGDLVEGSKVIVAEEVPYKGGYTYDILPSGETGTYWANGVLLRSTLKN
jgi:hypothetical protein